MGLTVGVGVTTGVGVGLAVGVEVTSGEDVESTVCVGSGEVYGGVTAGYSFTITEMLMVKMIMQSANISMRVIGFLFTFEASPFYIFFKL